MQRTSLILSTMGPADRGAACRGERGVRIFGGYPLRGAQIPSMDKDRLTQGKVDRTTFAAGMQCMQLIQEAMSASGVLGRTRHVAATVLTLLLSGLSMAQGTEDFTNLPATPTPGSYIARTWTGTDGVTWTAQGARTDQTMTGRAICFGNTGINRWVTSPVYANGMGTLSFEYVRGFTGTGARTIQVWVNGIQIGSNITVSPTSDVVQTYSQAMNIGGSVQLEIRSTGAAQVKLDNIVWTPYTAGPTVSFSAATQSTPEGSGVVPVSFNISPATVTGGTITLSLTNGAGVVYGAGGDYTTAPAGGSGSITVNVPAGATSASFNVNLIPDPFWEPNKTITFAVTGVTGDLELGFPNTHVFTILNDDFTPTAFFGATSVSHLESAGLVNIPITITPAATAGTLTLGITNGPGATYGSDYTTAPDGSGGSITLNVPAGATTVNIPVTLLDDLDVEDTEPVTFTITGATGGLLFGPAPSFVLNISDNDSPPTVLEPGDLVILAVNANTGGCIGTPSSDEVSFMCFKDIVVGTTLDITDQGYSRCTAGLWGTNEGLLRLVRTGPTITAGTVITLRSNGSGVVTGVMPDAGWSATAIDGLLFMNLNSNGDQLFFMQGGTWINPVTPAHNASYVGGTILYGFSTNGQWLANQCLSGAANQHSGLPPQMQCFSMEPTAASDWTKYTGPLTPTSQRGWILRIGDPGNWTSYSSCATFSSGAPNYAGGMSLPITTVGFTSGRWTGGVSTDWFDCKNWDDARVPTIVTPVLIDPVYAARSCEVGIIAGSTAECASLDHVSGGAVRQLTVRQSSSLTIDGPLTINRTIAGGALATTVLDNSELNCSTVVITGTTAGANEAVLRCDVGSTVRVEDDLTIGVGGLLDLQGAVGTSGTLFLGGDWMNLEDELKFQDLNSRVIFNGNVDQTITTGAGAEVFGALQLAKSGGDLILNNPVEVRTELDLGSGRVFTTAANLLTLRAGSAAINFTDLSFVHGPMQKIGNTAFTFPVGKGPNLRPCGLSTISGANSGAFQAEYFPVSGYTFGTAMEPTLDHISDCEHWIIDRTAGSGNAVVELTWDTPESCGVTDPVDLRVARWDAGLSIWQDRGNGGATPLAPAGTVLSGGVQTLFSPWTLASVTNENPLPITLIGFTAKPEGPNVRLDWSTASERNNDFFTVERSADGLLFDPILTVPGAGHSDLPLSYTDLDRSPLLGVSYYRLRQTDHDGTSAVSPVVSVVMGRNTVRPLSLFVAQGQLNALHGFATGSRYELLDMTGRLISAGVVQSEGSLSIPLPALQSGAYLLRLTDGERAESSRFVY